MLNEKDEKGRPRTYWGGLAEPERYPDTLISYNCTCGKTMKFESINGIVAPQRAWVGLTEEEKQDLYDRWVRTGDGWGLFYLLIEAKLQEKNHYA